VTSRYLVEGKRWVHSPGLGTFVQAHADRLASDASLWENSWLDDDGRLLLKLGEKGVLYLRLRVRTLSRDLTSQNAAILPAATARLVGALACLQGPDGDVRVPGFADDVREPTAPERELLRAVPFDGGFLRRRAGVDAFRGDLDDAVAAEAIRTRPTLTVTGIEGGDMRDDVTLGLPATAAAKVEVRLVPGQDADRVLGCIRDHLSSSGFDDVRVEVMATSRPNVIDPGHPFVALVADAARRTYGTEPVVEPYTQWIGNQGVMGDLPIVGVGVSRADSGIDGPDEHIRLGDYRLGVRHVVEVMAAMGER
jgi:acetylornithine deacetylase/succinyl-diaminopimelate desuccinylase-like protein